MRGVPSCWGTHFLYLSNPPSGNLLPIIPWVSLSAIFIRNMTGLSLIDTWYSIYLMFIFLDEVFMLQTVAVLTGSIASAGRSTCCSPAGSWALCRRCTRPSAARPCSTSSSCSRPSSLPPSQPSTPSSARRGCRPSDNNVQISWIFEAYWNR